MAELSLLESCESCGYRDTREGVRGHRRACTKVVVVRPVDGGCPETAPMTADKPHQDETEDDDPVSRAVGEYGRWQLTLTFLLSLFNIPCTWHIFAPTFQAQPVDFWCARPPSLKNMSVEVWRRVSQPLLVGKDNSSKYDPCFLWDLDYSRLGSLAEFLPSQNLSKRSCSKWEFDHSEFGDTITAQWDLVCSRSQLGNVAEMMFLAGVAIGGLVSGMVSDRFGRKKTLMGSLVLQIAVAIFMSFNPLFELYLVLRFCLGFISVGIVFSGFVLCMELVGGKWRTISGVSYLFPVPLSYITIAGIAYFVRGWKRLQIAITLPSILLFGLWWVLPESPRWLLALGRKEEVLAILKDAARTNKRALPANVDKMLQQATMTNGSQTEPRAGILDLFRTPNLRRNSLVLYVIWFTVYLVYYGLVLNLGNIGGDVYINTVLSGVVEIPAIAISILFLLRMGRRWPLCLTVMGSGVACLLTLTVPQGELGWLTITLAMVGKFSISASNAVMPVFTAELFPTVVRNLGVGSSNVSAGIALMLVPYLWNLTDVDWRVPMGVLGTFGVVGGLCVLLLPETADRPLVGSLQEGEQLPRRPSLVERQRRQSSTGNCNGSYAE